MKKKKDNPYVSFETCNARHIAVDGKLTEILCTLRGNPDASGDLGIMGDVRDIKRDKKWVYALLTLIGIPVLFLIVKFVFGL